MIWNSRAAARCRSLRGPLPRRPERRCTGGPGRRRCRRRRAWRADPDTPAHRRSGRPGCSRRPAETAARGGCPPAPSPGTRALATLMSMVVREVGVDARPVPVDEGGEDALAFGMMLVGRAVLEADPIAGRAGEVALEVVGGQEHQGVEPRHADLADGGLGLEQRGQRLRLAVGEEDGVVLGAESCRPGSGSRCRSRPRCGLPTPCTRPARSPAWSGRADRPRRWRRRWSGTRSWPRPGTDRGRADPCG